MSAHIAIPHRSRAAALALVPMAAALVGLYLDERSHFGYSNWRSACRAAGFDVAAMITFTVDLMPRAALGALLGVMLVQALGAVWWRGGGAPRAILAAHAGCAVGMAAMLLLCAYLPSMPWMLAVDSLLAVVTATWLCHGRDSTRFFVSTTSQASA